MDWASIFGGIGNGLGSIGSGIGSGLGSIGSGLGSMFTTDNMSKLGNFGQAAGGIGGLYSGYKAGQLGDKSIDLTKQQNKFIIDAYNKEEDNKEKRNQSFASVWG